MTKLMWYVFLCLANVFQLQVVNDGISFMCVCAHTCACPHVCMYGVSILFAYGLMPIHMYVCIQRGQRTILGTLLSLSPPYILRQGFLLELGLTDWLAWLTSALQNSSISTRKALGLQTYVSPCPTFIWMQGFTPRSSSLYS